VARPRDPLEASRPRVEPGFYQARSVKVTAFNHEKWGRRLLLWFELFVKGEAGHGEAPMRWPAPDGPVLQLPMYLKLPEPGRPLLATSKLARIFDLLGTRPVRLDRLPLKALKGRLWSVQVVDVRVSGERNYDEKAEGQQPLNPRQYYSVVKVIKESWL
jgi:hypothetical protein